MAIKKRRTVMSVNKNIDKRISRSSMEVGRGISELMMRGKKSAISGRKNRMESVFEIKDKGRTLLG